MKDKKAGAADLDAAIERAPNDAPARFARAWLRFRGGDKAGARQDAAAADRALARPNDSRFELAQLYDALGLTAQAIGQYDAWIDTHPHDSKLAVAYNNRCWLRATHGIELDAALSDCDHALHLQPHNPSYLDSRGLAHLRNGDAKEAIEDYDEAIAKDPKLVSSLYGRGIAKQRLGKAAAGKADIAAARKIEPDIAETMKADGLAP